MKRFLLLLAVGIFAVGCQTDQTADNPINEEGTTISISLEPTRTSLGNKGEDGIYPVFWSEGDKIVVNGKLSNEVKIDAENRTKASFSFAEGSISHPYHITYPYSASTTAEQSIVEFLGEQNYAEGTFALGSTPMCGYSEASGNTITLSHLASVLRLPIKAKTDGATLEKVVITSMSGAKLSGEFAVNCENATISATENSSSVVTYNLPVNFTLSTTNTQVLYIALPAVTVGNCTIEFVENTGEKMVASWAPNKPLSKGVVREFKTIEYAPKSYTSLQPLEVEEDEFKIFYKKVYGHVKYSDGTPIANVAVSDGFQVVTTDTNGYYELSGITSQTWYIYCSLPADVKVPIDELGRPCFFKKYPANSPQYDFTFEKLPNGPEKEFAIFALGDPQPSNEEHVARFAAQCAPEVKSYAKTFDIPCYGIVLGDIVNNQEHLLDNMRDEWAYERMGMPMFAVMGNHDNAAVSTSNAIFPDERNSSINIKYQRPFEENFGPVNYSFNRGDAHFVCMRDTEFLSNFSAISANTKRLITDEQFEWFKQDIALVSRDKMIVLCVHEQMFNGSGTSKYRNFQNIFNIMDEFEEAHILSAHLHYNRPYDYRVAETNPHNIYEHNISAVCGRIWRSNLADDGSPCGYQVLLAKNNSFSKWYYKGFPYMMNDADFQIRLYRGNEITGCAIPEGDANKSGTKGYYQFGYGSDVILANVFSSDPWNWTVEVWEDGEYSGKMESLRSYNYTPSFVDLIGTFTYEDPKRPATGVESGMDFYAVGVQLGWKGADYDDCYKPCYTMWKYTLVNPDAEHIEVRAKDSFGNVYTANTFQVGTDITYAIYDPANNPTIE